MSGLITEIWFAERKLNLNWVKQTRLKKLQILTKNEPENQFRVHKSVCVRYGAVPIIHTDPSGHLVFLGETKYISSSQIGEWQTGLQSALLVNKDIPTDTLLLRPQPERLQFSLEAIYEDIIPGASAQLERERPVRNGQLKMK